MPDKHMTPEEREVMRQAYVFLDRNSDPPATSDPESVGWWTEMVSWVVPLLGLTNNHPLMLKMIDAMMEYAEDKAKEKTRREEESNV